MKLLSLLDSNVSNIGVLQSEKQMSQTILVNFDEFIEDEKWTDPYDSIWLKLVTILVYMIEGRHS